MTARPLHSEYDAVIVGAGPAGGMLANLLATRSWRVLLVERSKFPRDKTCGGCLNAAAVARLEQIGLRSLTQHSAAIDRFYLQIGRRSLELPLAPGAAIGRDELDTIIVQRALEQDCEFLCGTPARLLPGGNDNAARHVVVGEDCVAARVVFACDGINGTLLNDEPGVNWTIAEDAYFGVAASGEAIANVARGTIHMHVGDDGYVGTVRFADGRVHLAAALDPIRCKSAGGAAPLVEQIFHECDAACPIRLEGLHLNGTGKLTRRRKRLGSHRVLCVGDACGYVEPFTGEGIAWALDCAREAAQLFPDGAPARWSERIVHDWTARHRRAVASRQRWCQVMRRVLRHPRLARACAGVAALQPAIGEAVARWFSRPRCSNLISRTACE